MRTFRQRLVGVPADGRRWRIDGEQDVARRLTRLGTGWHVLHAVPIGTGGSDIAHLVIGPAGVFTIALEDHAGTSELDGADELCLQDSRYAAARATIALSLAANERVDVRGIVVGEYADCDPTAKGPSGPGHVSTVSRRSLLDHLRELPPQLDEETVARIHEVACHVATPGSAPGPMNVGGQRPPQGARVLV